MQEDQKFRKELLVRQQPNMHVRFFEEDPKRQHIVVPIFSKLSPKIVITPFRNTECQKPSCIYHIDDLVAKYIDSGYSKMHGFICYNCDKYIYLKNFYLDHALKKIIDSIWATINKENKVICKKVSIMRDGHWEPHLPEYLKYLDKNLQKSLNAPAQDRKVKGYHGAHDGVHTLINYEKPPPLSEYNKRDYKELLDDLFAERVRGDQVLFERDGVPISKDDIMNAENENSISPKMVALFCNYLNTIQRIEPGKYNINNKNRCFTVGINVVNYDKFYKKAKYQLYYGFRNPYRGKPQKLCHEHDKLILIFKYDNRWICTTVDLRSHVFYIVDFLSEDLSCVKYEELLDLAKSLVSQEFGVPYQSHEILDDTRINYLNDCGLYSLNYLYKVTQNQHTDLVRVKPPEKELFRKQLVWLTLRLRNAKTKKIEMFNFPEKDDEPGAPKLTENNLRKLELQYQREQQDKQKRQQQAKEVSIQVSSTMFSSEKSSVLDLDVSQKESPAQQKLENSLLKLLSDDNKPDEIPAVRKSMLQRKSTLVPRQSQSKSNHVPLVQQVKGDPRIMNDFNALKRASIAQDESDDDMIELRKDQLKDLLDDFKNEVLGSIKQEKIKQQQNVRAPPSLYQRIDEEDSSSEGSSDDSDIESSQTTLPRIGGAPYGVQNPYMQANPYMNNPYLYGYGGRSETSYDSMSDMSRSELSSQFGGFGSKSYVKGKKPDIKRGNNESVFDYSVPGTKLGKGKSQDKKMFGIAELDESKSSHSNVSRSYGFGRGFQQG